MDYRILTYPSAKSEKQWLCETYGMVFCEEFDAWCRHIVRLAPHNPKALNQVSLDDLLDEKHKPWSYVWREVKDKTAIDRLKSLKAFLGSGRPPIELIAVHARFLVQNRFHINIDAIARIDRGDKSVSFVNYTWFGDERT